jgi:hypothetical protein
LLTQMIAVGIWNVLSVNIREAIMSFCFFFNAIGQKVLSEEPPESLEKRHYETLRFLEMYLPPAFFDINFHFTTHPSPDVSIREIQWHTEVIHLKLSLPEGSMVQGYCIEEAIE